jgi:hypothetical protein
VCSEVTVLYRVHKVVRQFCVAIDDHVYDLSKSKSKSHYDRQSVGQSVLVSGVHLGPATNFSFSLKLYLDSCGFVIM